MLTDMDVRHKAAAILSGPKLRMLEEAGLTVVEKQRLEAMEKVRNAATTLVSEASALVDDDTYEYVPSSNMDALRDSLAEMEAMEK